MADMQTLFSDEVCRKIFPPEKADAFFDALFGDASEGAYDIELKFTGFDQSAKELHFELNLHERPGCCLACNLTYGLPEVFSRHPVININGVVKEVDKILGDTYQTTGWSLRSTRSTSKSLHQIPLVITLS
ncbi:MAG: pancreas/duodenum homeobox protein 1 [Proteobacteria bacterium]|nr:pancreas/duodenum homeobox protein 1 [Pseudomonadota bacterium]MBU1640275.1 pancreas/duodenum homeobox protein 1 [Pseudomonadota bacterium]